MSSDGDVDKETALGLQEPVRALGEPKAVASAKEATQRPQLQPQAEAQGRGAGGEEGTPCFTGTVRGRRWVSHSPTTCGTPCHGCALKRAHGTFDAIYTGY